MGGILGVAYDVLSAPWRSTVGSYRALKVK